MNQNPNPAGPPTTALGFAAAASAAFAPAPLTDVERTEQAAIAAYARCAAARRELMTAEAAHAAAIRTHAQTGHA